MEKKGFKMPHSFVIIFIMLLIVFAMGNLIDAGEFERVANEAGKMVVVPGSYHKMIILVCLYFNFLFLFSKDM